MSALLHARVAVRERSLLDVLDLALRFIVVHRRSYWRTALGWLAPLLLVAIGGSAALGFPRAWVLALPLAMASEVPFTVLASRLVFEDEVRGGDVLRTALLALPRFLLARALSLLLIALGLALFVVPAVWLLAVLLFVAEVMLLERTTVREAFGRARQIATSATAETILGGLVLGAVPLGAVLFADVAGRALISELFQFRPPAPIWVEGGSALAVFGLVVQAPYLATARFFLYLDVRTRAEGWDIQTRFAAIAAQRETP